MASSYLCTLRKDFSLWWGIVMRITIYEKGVYHALCFSDSWKPRKLFKILSRSIAMIDAHGYDYSHILIVDCRLWNFISEVLSYNEVYCVFISAWGLELLVLTRWAIPRASAVERVMDIAPRLFCYGKTH